MTTGDILKGPPLNQADTQPSAWNTPQASSLNEEVDGSLYSRIALVRANSAVFKSANPFSNPLWVRDKVEELEENLLTPLLLASPSKRWDACPPFGTSFWKQDSVLKHVYSSPGKDWWWFKTATLLLQLRIELYSSHGYQIYH